VPDLIRGESVDLPPGESKPLVTIPIGVRAPAATMERIAVDLDDARRVGQQKSTSIELSASSIR
jgi:hypothetical protein